MKLVLPVNDGVAAAVCILAAIQYQPAVIVWLIVIVYVVDEAVQDTVPASNSTVVGLPAELSYTPNRTVAVPLKVELVLMAMRLNVVDSGK